ncbi:MAG: hypothetical protein AB8E82_01820 [Aureispira sp.]
MKRLKLEDFKVKNLKQETNQIDQLLGQVLGDCHDGTVKNKFDKANSGVSNEVQF